MLRSEWRDWVPPAHSALGYTSPKRFHELVARATVQRLQLACGLETEMYYSFDKVGETERESEREEGGRYRVVREPSESCQGTRHRTQLCYNVAEQRQCSCYAGADVWAFARAPSGARRGEQPRAPTANREPRTANREPLTTTSKPLSARRRTVSRTGARRAASRTAGRTAPRATLPLEEPLESR